MAAIPLNRASGQQARRNSLDVAISAIENSIQEIRGKCRYLLGHPGFRNFPLLTLFRLICWRLHCAFGIPATFSLPRWRARFYLPPRWRGAGTTMVYALRAQYEKELMHLDRFLSAGMTVVDCGANCGIYTVAAAKLVGRSGLVLSFEPGADSFSILEKNIQLNHLVNVRVYRTALSDKEGKAALYHHQHGPNSFSLGPPDAGEIDFEEVPSRTLCQVLQHEGVPRIGLIKLDVEGAEELVLRGAEPILAHSHPTIIFEVNGAAAKRLGLGPTGSWNLLKSLGYQFFSLAEWGHLSRLDHPPEESDPINLIAIHARRPK